MPGDRDNRISLQARLPLRLPHPPVRHLAYFVNADIADWFQPEFYEREV
jgi:hypothetical protein